jgi:hypothetical protein
LTASTSSPWQWCRPTGPSRAWTTLTWFSGDQHIYMAPCALVVTCHHMSPNPLAFASTVVVTDMCFCLLLSHHPSFHLHSALHSFQAYPRRAGLSHIKTYPTCCTPPRRIPRLLTLCLTHVVICQCVYCQARAVQVEGCCD